MGAPHIGKTVWLLGSGFSKSLDGPLLSDLFRQEELADIEPFFPRGDFDHLGQQLYWVQRIFNQGVTERLWSNAEQFLAYVDQAYRPGGDARKTRIANTAERAIPIGTAPKDFSDDINRSIVSQGVKKLWDGEVFPLLVTLNNAVRRALAAECSKFLLTANPASEPWLPYTTWFKNLIPGVDTVITFNYDRVIETAAGDDKRLWVVPPKNETPRLDAIPVLKVHGSVDWVLDEQDNVVKQGDPWKPLRDPAARIVIASPGPSKAEVINARLEQLWTMAERALGEASRLVIIGYSSPQTDPAAQIRIWNGFRNDSSGAANRQVHLVLGPETTSPTSRRLLAIAKSGGRRRFVTVNREREQQAPTAPERLDVLEHPLWAEDFIGRCEQYFERQAPR